MWPFTKKSDDRSVDALLAQANAASPTGAVSPAGPFRMPVEDVFTITGRGTVVTGRVESGSCGVGQQVGIARDGQVVATTTITGVEMFRKKVDTAGVGDHVGLLLSGVSREQVHAGDVVQV